MKKTVTVLLLFFGSKAFAQSSGIHGVITGRDQKVVSKATIRLLNTNYGSISDNAGRYRIEKLENGNYTISVSAVGYATQIRSFSLSEGQQLTLLFRLAESSQQLNEVAVSSEKRQESIQEIPAAITALDAKQIRDYRLWDITNLTALAPNLFTVEHGNSTSSNFFNIRGVMGFSNEQAVATYIDGVYQFDYFSAPPLFNDIQSIEILRGPQGTLYGRNAFGGVVNITTKQPGNSTSCYAEINVGNYGQQRYTASLSTPVLKNKLFASGSFTYNRRGAIYHNAFSNSGFDGRENYSGNINLRYNSSQRWSFALNLKAENDRDRGSFPWLASYNEVLAKPYQVNTNNTNVERRRNFNTSFVTHYFGKKINFTSVSSYVNWNGFYEGRGVDYDFGPLDILSTAPNIKHHVFAEELRFSSPSSSTAKLKWVAGAYGFLQRTGMTSPTFYGPDYRQIDPAANAPFTTTNVSRGTNRGFAFFGQAVYALSPKFDFTAGLRYDHESRKLGQYTNYRQGDEPETLLTPNQDYRAAFDAFTPKLVLSYKPKENMLLYGSYARGFRVGGLNTNAPTPEQVPYEQEHSDNYEIGWKNTLLNNRLKLNITAFYLQQLNQQISSSHDGINQLILNVGEMHNRGIELEMTALPVKGLQVDWNASYSYARYTSLLLYSNEEQAIVNYKGNQPINTPPLSSMLAAQYTYDFRNAAHPLSVYLRGEYRHLGRYYFDFINGLSQPAYPLFNGKAGVTFRNLELNFWARNITGEKYVAYGSFGSFLLGSPRTYGSTLIAKF